MSIKNNKTYYLLILDKSGSMQNCKDSTISGFNEQVQMMHDLKKKFPEQDMFVSLTTFNHAIDYVSECETLETLKILNEESYRPDGRTALLDAIGHSLIRLNQKIEKEIEAGEASVVVLIITDGMENASSVFNRVGIASLIKKLEDTKLWTVQFMGTNWEQVYQAESFGISRAKSRVYLKNELRDDMAHFFGGGMSSYMAGKRMNKVKDNIFDDTKKD